jgi:diguanylate cyclase (GGDEF)-like protein
VDLDHFKLINDTLDHLHGDEVLKLVADRLRAAFGDRGFLARLAGDEFALILRASDAEAARESAAPLQVALHAPLVHEGDSMIVGASAGIAVFPVHGRDAWSLLRLADSAMYMAKGTRGVTVVDDPERDVNSPRRLALAGELRRAIGHDELVLHYRPKLDLRIGRTSGVGALVRWQHPREGLLSPDRFLPLVEQVGLVGPLNMWVFRAALAQCARWLDEGR